MSGRGLLAQGEQMSVELFATAGGVAAGLGVVAAAHMAIECRTLELLESAEEAVPELDQLHLHDSATLSLLRRGHTVAVRYLNNPATQSALRARVVRSVIDLADFFERGLHPIGRRASSPEDALDMALGSYRDAYLKANHPAEFMSATVEMVLATGNPLPEALIAECEVLGVGIVELQPLRMSR
jgi:hypothetical protein